MPLETQVKLYQASQQYGDQLIAEIDPATVFIPIAPGANHPAWQIGHLAWAGHQIVQMLGGEPGIDIEAYGKLFAGGTQPVESATAYPTWREVIGAWHDAHRRVEAAAPAVDAAALGQPSPVERMKDTLPTLGDFVSFLLANHESVHLGELAAWRRVRGQPPLF